MCIIIHKPAGKVISEKDIISAATRNSHGFGYMYYNAETKKVVAHKQLFKDPKDLLPFFKSQEHLEVVYHMRVRTQGATDQARCHPFQILSRKKNAFDMFYMHNGTIHKVKEEGDESDTQAFVRQFLRPILKQKPALIKTPAFQAMVTDYIGQYSKLVFMMDNGEIIKINEKGGKTYDGMWVSNDYPFIQTTNYRGGTTAVTKTNDKVGDEDRYERWMNKHWNSSNKDIQTSTHSLAGEPVKVGDLVYIYHQNNDFFEEGEIKKLSPHTALVSFKTAPSVTEEVAFYLVDGESSYTHPGFTAIPANMGKGCYFGVEINDKETPPPQTALEGIKSMFIKPEDKKKEETPIAPTLVSHISSTGQKTSIDAFDHRWGGAGVENSLQDYDGVTVLDIYKMTAQERFDFFMENTAKAFGIFQDLVECRVLDDIDNDVLYADTLEVNEEEEENEKETA